MKREPHPAAPPDGELLPRLFAGLFGTFLGLSLLKFGNPPIMENWVTAPTDGYEFILGYPWPIAWAYLLLALVAVPGILTARWNVAAPRWLIALPLVWLAWQLTAGAQTVDAQLTRVTLKHFAACVACFYLGLFSLSRVQRLWPFWTGLVCGFLLVLAVGWQQHFGGLDETRRYFFLYLYPKLKEISPEYLKKMSSNRIFSTLFYPNSLAGAVLLLLPVALGVIERTQDRFTLPAKWFLAVAIGVAALACLYWSGSKGGWLMTLLLGLIVLRRLPLGKQLKLAFIANVLLAGLAGFFWKHSAFFEKGATSVSARFDYWHAAVQTAKANPLVGTGPGTFLRPYEKIRRPDSEPSRLVHNDYLEQASDSGLPGFLAYAAFIVGALVWSFPVAGQPRGLATQPAAALAPPRHRSRSSSLGHDYEDEDEADTRILPTRSTDWLPFAVWLGVLGWALQGLLEFDLYIPALAWPALALLGWLLGRDVPGAGRPAANR